MNEDPEDRSRESAAAALRVLDRPLPVTSGWRPGDVVRRSVRRRRAGRWLGSAVVVLAAVTAAVALTGGSGSPATRPPAPLAHSPRTRVADRIDGAVQLVADSLPTASSEPGSIRAVAAADRALTVALLQHLDAGRSTNVSVSPSSLYLALAMLQNGARGKTLQEISTALSATGLDTDRQNAGLAGLTQAWAGAARRGDFTLESANSLWQQRGLAVKPQFLAELATYYQAGVWQADFGGDMAGALKAIDAWTAAHTHGKITKLFDQLDPATVLVLANAIYFHAAWATPFDGHATEPMPFTTSTGQQVQAQFMSGGPGLKTAVTGRYQAVELPYRGGRFAALAVMPRGRSLGSFVAGLHGADLGRIAATVAARPASTVAVVLPRFTTTSTLPLNDALAAMGMPDAFTDGADFSGLSDTPTTIGQVLQRVYLAVGENGTTAAAITGVGMTALSAHVQPPRLAFDHPFLFLIRDTATGAIVFATELQDPTA